MNLRAKVVSEQVSTIFLGILIAFIGILISFVLGVLGFYSKLLEIVKSLTKIEEHTGKISGLEDKMIELRLAFEKGKLSSIPVELPKSQVQLIVKVKDRTEKTTEFEITAREPIPTKIAQKSVESILPLGVVDTINYSTYQMSLILRTTDPRIAAENIKKLLDALDQEWFAKKHWEDTFKAEMSQK